DHVLPGVLNVLTAGRPLSAFIRRWYSSGLTRRLDEHRQAMINTNMENKSFVLLLALVSIAFVAILLPFYGAVFWGTILAIIFYPMQRRFENRFNGRRGWAAAVTLVIILVIVILPLSLMAGALVQEGTNIYQRVSSGARNSGDYLEEVVNALPALARGRVARSRLA